MMTVENNVKKIVVVQFESAYKQYDFKNDIEGLNEGDKVVVDTAMGYCVATVTGFKDISTVAAKWVVQKIDLDSHTARLDKEKKLKALKNKMEARREQLQEIEIYQILAKEDEDMAKLLEEFKELN